MRSPERAASALQPKAQILVVDDIFENRNLLSRYLQRRGYTVTEASSGEEALAVLASTSFDCVLLDVMMPGIGGLETLRRIRLKSCAQRLPVVMVTAKALSEDVDQALSLGANDYITKPVDLPVVLVRVENQIKYQQIAMAAKTARLDLAQSRESRL